MICQKIYLVSGITLYSKSGDPSSLSCNLHTRGAIWRLSPFLPGQNRIDKIIGFRSLKSHWQPQQILFINTYQMCLQENERVEYAFFLQRITLKVGLISQSFIYPFSQLTFIISQALCSGLGIYEEQTAFLQ